MIYDFDDDIGSEDLRVLHQLLDQLADVRNDVAVAEAELGGLKAQEAQLSQELIPDKMAELGLSEFKDAHGRKVSLREKVFASTSASKDPERHRQAMRWLVENGHSGLIKTKVVQTFSKGDADKAAALQQQLNEEGYNALIDETVHPSTLRAWAREMLEQGVDFPHDLFGVQQRSNTIIT